MGAPAPLISLAEAPAPAGGVAEWVSGEGGVRLRAALFPAHDPRGSVVLSPGRTEVIEKYGEVVDELRGRRLTVLAHDWRGQGFSGRLTADPLRGHASGWRPFVGDYRRLLDHFEARLPRPWLALGHSMGGTLTALALDEGIGGFAGAALSAPMMGLNLGGRPVPLVSAVARLMSLVGQGAGYANGPGEPVGGAFEDSILTHDRRRWERTRALLVRTPEFQQGGATWGWLAFALQATARLARARRLPIPVTVVTAEDERLVDNPAAKAYAERVGATYLEVPGAFHEVLMETDARRAQFWTAFDDMAKRALTT